MPPLLAVAYLAVLLQNFAVARPVLLLVSYLFSVSCVATYGHIINDSFDVDADRQVGKHNAMSGVSWGGRTLLGTTFLIAGFLPAPIVDYSLFALLLLALNYLWPTLYSLPSIRFKEKGLLGVICDAMGSHVTPTLLAISIFMPMKPIADFAGFGFPLVVTLWAAVLGIKGILHHQLIDRDNDLATGTITLGTKTTPEVIGRFLTWFNLWVELPISAVLVLVVYSWCPLALAAFVIYCGMETLKYARGFKFALTDNPRTVRANVPFTNEMFYVLWLPMAAATQLAIRDPAWMWLPVIHAAVFYPVGLRQMREWIILIVKRWI
jgi:4-hydroxybenzoate polyprenyltransferase